MALEERFRKDVPHLCVMRAATEKNTGALEVEVNGALIHSKLNGDGFIDSAEKLEKIFAHIEAGLPKNYKPPSANSLGFRPPTQDEIDSGM